MPQRVAVITDIHANLPALEAALSAIDAAGCDAIYFLCDAIILPTFYGISPDNLS
jgi:hypothetical protein